MDLDDTHTVTCDFFISPENMSDEVQFSTVKFPVLQCHHNLESMQTFPGDCSILSWHSRVPMVSIKWQGLCFRLKTLKILLTLYQNLSLLCQHSLNLLKKNSSIIWIFSNLSGYTDCIYYSVEYTLTQAIFLLFAKSVIFSNSRL